MTSSYNVLSQLAASSSEVSFVGHTSIRGTKTSEYRIRLDPKELATRPHGLYGRNEGNVYLAQAEWDRVASYPLKVWIDSRGRLSRLCDRER